MPAWLKISLKILGAIIGLLILILIGLSIYVSSHKEKVLAMVAAELNKNLNGKIEVGGIETSFFASFPDLAITLKNVSLRDKEWIHHHQTLLDAKKMEVAVNTAALLKGSISVNHIDISDAAIDLYTDSSGYSNTSIFKKDTTKKKKKDSSSSSPTEIDKFSLKNVVFTVDDRKNNKLFKFAVNDLKSKMDFPDSGWNAHLHLDVLAESMAFSTTHGSFIKGKALKGDLAAGYNKTTGDINVTSSNFIIGGDDFSIIARFALAKNPASFTFHITAGNLLWSKASQLVSPNISKKLDMFDLDKPIAVTALIAGSFSGGGDPYLYITADVNNNRLTIPGTVVDGCAFKGVFTNSFVKGKQFGDENSVIRLTHFTGNYNRVPFVVDTVSIINLVNPIAVGNFRANFPVADLNYLLSGIAKFGNGTADLNMHFNADVVNYQVNKPIISGSINLKNADISYLPANLNFKNTSLGIQFINNNLFINNVRLQSGKSVVLMNARVNNFLNLYYNSPDKIVLNWQITSPELYLGEFIGFLNGPPSSAAKTTASSVKSKQSSGSAASQLRTVLNKAKVTMHIRAANVHYFKFLATDATADLLFAKEGIQLNNVSLKHAGGTLKINATIVQKQFNLNAIISSVDIHEFMYAFDNFGLKGITSENLKGLLSAKTNMSGRLNDAGAFIPGSADGTIDLNLKDAALINYQPLISVGKFAFPFRNLHNIAIPVLDAHFDVHNKLITIHPFQITSSVINADVAGVYGLANGTNITIDVPLRDPSKDASITDPAERAKKRNKGIVVHIRAADDENGKLKIGRNKDYKLL